MSCWYDRSENRPRKVKLPLCTGTLIGFRAVEGPTVQWKPVLSNGEERLRYDRSHAVVCAVLDKTSDSVKPVRVEFDHPTCKGGDDLGLLERSQGMVGNTLSTQTPDGCGRFERTPR